MIGAVHIIGRGHSKWRVIKKYVDIFLNIKKHEDLVCLIDLSVIWYIDDTIYKK